MVGLFESNLDNGEPSNRKQALSIAALCVGGMVLARTLANDKLASEVRKAAHQTATQLASLG